MKMYIVAVHYADMSKKNIIGFRILDLDSKEVKDYPYDAVKSVLMNKVEIKGIEYDNKSHGVKGSNGALERYPAIIQGTPVTKSLVILNSIDNVGYQVSSYTGKIGHASRNEVVKFAIKSGIANGKVVEKDGKKFISAINGTYTNIPYNMSELSKTKSAKLREVDRETAKQIEKNDIIRKSKKSMSNANYRPKVITGNMAENSLLHMVDDISGLTVEQKMVYVMLAMKAVRPFCYAVYTCLDRVETEDIPTMAVTLRTFYFNPYFVLKKSLSDLLFIVIHEVYHISMKHRIREMNRNHDLWNKACDYYINRVIADEFGLEEMGVAKDARRKSGGSGVAYTISLPTDCLYNKNVLVDKDTPEKIYEELEQIRNEMMQNDSADGEDSNDEGNSQQSSGSASNKNKKKNKEEEMEDEANQNDASDDRFDPGAHGSNNRDDSGSEGEEDDTQLDGDEEGESDGDDLDDLANGGDGKNKKKKKSMSKDLDSSTDDEGEDSTGDKNSKSKAGKEDNDSNDETNSRSSIAGGKFRGQEIPDLENDMVDGADEKSESPSRLDQIANSILKRAAARHRLETGSFGGECGDWLERYVEKILAPKIKWIAVLKNKLTLASQRINTFTAPDKRFRSRNMVLPGPKKMENDTLENVKICVDTSGSISPKDLGIALDQIDQLFKTFKADAELLYWDTQIRAIYPFKEPRELLSKKPMGGGGTDANCIFDYFENNRDYKIGKKKRPNIIIIFTDGYFGEINNAYKKYKDTIWVIQGNNGFNAPFGTVAPFKIDQI